MKFDALLLGFLMFLSFIILVRGALPESEPSNQPATSYIFELRGDLSDHKGAVHSVAFSPDGRLIASGSADSSVKFWYADSGKRAKALMRHPYPVLCVAFSPDGNILAAGLETGAISLWDVNYKERIKTLKGHKDHVWSVRFSPDGSLLASGSADSNVKLWDMKSGKEVKTLSGHKDSVYSLSFSPDGKVLASGSADGTIRVWAYAGAAAGWLKDVTTLKESTGTVNSVCFSPDGKTLASGSGDGTVRLWDASSGNEIKVFDGQKDVIGIDDCLSFSPDGRILASGKLVWDVGLNTPLHELKGHKTAVDSIAFSPDGRQIASAGLDGIVKLWRIRVIESLKATLDAGYEVAIASWQRGALKLKADVLGLPDVVKFQYSFDGFEWSNIAELKEPPYLVDWNTRSSIPNISKAVYLRVVAERASGATAMDLADGVFSVDNEPPNTKHDYDGLWHRQDFDINLSADDGDGAGLSATKYRLNYGQEKDIRWNGQPRITKEGTNTLEYWSVDKLGNEESHKSIDAKLDKTAPAFSGWLKVGAPTGPFRVSVRVTDESGSGLAGKVSQFDYHIGSDTPYDGYENMSTADNQVWYYDIPEPAEGWNHYLGKSIYFKARSEDAAGNAGESAEQQELIGSPKVPPTVKITNAFRSWERGTLVIKTEATDSDGEIKDVKFEYSTDNATWTPIEPVTRDASRVTGSWDTTKDLPKVAKTVWVRVKVTDNDGLSAEYVTPSFGIDNQPPITNHDYDGLWHKTDFAVNLKADDGDGSGISSIKCKVNDGYERDTSVDGQPRIYEQGKSTLEYWSIDVAGNEEAHKILSDVKLDRQPPFFENWRVERDNNILHIEVSVADADSGLGTTPQFDYRIGSDASYYGYKDMVKMDGDPREKRGWKYDVDISSFLPDAAGKTMFCRISAKDAVGNLGIKMWEYEIGSSKVTEPAPAETLSIKPAPVSEITGNVEPAVGGLKESSILWTLQTSGTAGWLVGDQVSIQGHLEPKMNKPVPLSITVNAPNDTVYVSRMDTDPNGAFQFKVPITTEGEWKITAEWQGDNEYKPVESNVLKIQTGLEKTAPDASDSKAQKAGRFLKKNTMIIGAIFLYILIIRLYKS